MADDNLIIIFLAPVATPIPSLGVPPATTPVPVGSALAKVTVPGPGPLKSEFIGLYWSRFAPLILKPAGN